MCQNCDNDKNDRPEGHPENCQCGSPRCPDATFDTLTKYVTESPVRIMKDPEGDLYLHSGDVEGALIAVVRIQELANIHQGAPPEAVQQLAMVQRAVVQNAGTILADEKRYVDLSTTEIPDAFPEDWL